MAVKHMRIDDRLIHGQIITAWIRDTKAQMIIVADDLAANDATQKMLLKLVTPKDIKLQIDTVDMIAKKLRESTDAEDTLLIVRTPKAAYDLLVQANVIATVNVGNISNSKSTTGRKTLLPYIHVEQQDAEYLRKIGDLGIKLDVRSVPTDRSINGMELISKTF